LNFSRSFHLVELKSLPSKHDKKCISCPKSKQNVALIFFKENDENIVEKF